MNRRRVRLLAVAAALLSAAPAAIGQMRNPYAGDARRAKAGQYEFRINCAFCHGLGAQGGGRGPDLRRAHKRHGDSDGELFNTINNGIPGTAMPPNGTTSQGVGMTDEEIWEVILYLRSVEAKAPAKPVGDAAHGRELFFGTASCSLCHMVQGKGGRLGPDLTTIGGARTPDYLVDSVRHPSRRLAQGLLEATKEFPQEYETVTVTTEDGKEITGVALNEDSFSVQLLDRSEHLYMFEKEKLRSFEKTRTSLMPAYDLAGLSDKDLHDIVAYLIGVGEK
jgi:putative heme-binding domain-containing protein